jgi:hypothetical protein
MRVRVARETPCRDVLRTCVTVSPLRGTGCKYYTQPGQHARAPKVSVPVNLSHVRNSVTVSTARPRSERPKIALDKRSRR